MGKITVKHYLHKGVNKGTDEVETPHLVYMQVTAKRQVNRLRSQANRLLKLSEEKPVEVNDYVLKLTQWELNRALAHHATEAGKALLLEETFVQDVVDFLNPFMRENFTIKQFALIYQIAITETFDALNTGARETLKHQINQSWPEICDILDWEKSFMKIFKGLRQLGSNDKAFKQSVLNNEYFIAAEVSLEHVNVFSRKYFKNPPWFLYSNMSSLPLVLYWLKYQMTNDFIEYLVGEGYIVQEQVQIVKKFVDDIMGSHERTLINFSTKTVKKNG